MSLFSMDDVIDLSDPREEEITKLQKEIYNLRTQKSKIEKELKKASGVQKLYKRIMTKLQHEVLKAAPDQTEARRMLSDPDQTWLKSVFERNKWARTVQTYLDDADIGTEETGPFHKLQWLIERQGNPPETKLTEDEKHRLQYHDSLYEKYEKRGTSIKNMNLRFVELNYSCLVKLQESATSKAAFQADVTSLMSTAAVSVGRDFFEKAESLLETAQSVDLRSPFTCVQEELLAHCHPWPLTEGTADVVSHLLTTGTSITELPEATNMRNSLVQAQRKYYMKSVPPSPYRDWLSANMPALIAESLRTQPVVDLTKVPVDTSLDVSAWARK